MKTINDIINNMTDEEKKQHAELINECIDREKMLDNIDIVGNYNALLDKLYLATLPDDKFFKE